jgi:type II secretory pathway component GspD/PulD (secretin)
MLRTLCIAVAAGMVFVIPNLSREAAPGAVLIAKVFRPTPAPSPIPVVVSLHEIPAQRAAEIIRGFYPNLRVRIDARANAVVAVAPPDEADAIRTILQGIDVRNPDAASVDAEVLHVVSPSAVLPRLRSVFPHARFFIAPNRTLITVASPDDLTQIKPVIAAIDTPPQTPTPKPVYPPEAVRVLQGNVKQIARAVAHQVPDVAVAISGSTIVVRGPPDDVGHAKDLVAQLDVPQRNATFAEVYRLRYADANAVASVIQQSYPGIAVAVNGDLNAVTVRASGATQDRVSQAIAQLDVAPAGSGTSGGAAPSIAVVNLNGAISASTGPSSTPGDIAQTVQQALQPSAPDLHITVPPNSTQLILTGSPYSIELAKELIAKLDVLPPMVVLDTKIVEMDEGVARQMGFEFPSAFLSTTYSETTPSNSLTGAAGRLLALQPLTRTPLSLVAELNFLVNTNRAKILEDPTITTFSGHTASIKAGETLNVLVTTGGGAGVVPTSQIQSFQTGVQLDIVPTVEADGVITLSLHPVVNSEAGISAAGVPNVQTRDVQTTVAMHEGQTLVIGGLIEDDTSRSVQKIPFLGDIPLIGKLFQDVNYSYSRNELLVTVTPHVEYVTAPQSASSSDLTTPNTPPALLPSASLPTPPLSLPVAASPHVIPTPCPASSADCHGERLASPSPEPTAFTQTNVYTFGSAPSNNYAAPDAAPQIFYVQVQPTVIADGQQMTISAITTSNVTKLVFGDPANPEAQLQSVTPGKWQSTFTFRSAGLPSAQSSVHVTLTATTANGGMVTVPIPISVVQQQ